MATHPEDRGSFSRYHKPGFRVRPVLRFRVSKLLRKYLRGVDVRKLVYATLREEARRNPEWTSRVENMNRVLREKKARRLARARERERRLPFWEQEPGLCWNFSKDGYVSCSGVDGGCAGIIDQWGGYWSESRWDEETVFYGLLAWMDRVGIAEFKDLPPSLELFARRVGLSLGVEGPRGDEGRGSSTSSPPEPAGTVGDKTCSGETSGESRPPVP